MAGSRVMQTTPTDSNQIVAGNTPLATEHHFIVCATTAALGAILRARRQIDHLESHSQEESGHYSGHSKKRVIY